MLWIGPPPTHSNAPPPEELEQMAAIARKYDMAERDACNRALGRSGKERVLAHERPACSRPAGPILPNASVGYRMSMVTVPATTSSASTPTAATG